MRSQSLFETLKLLLSILIVGAGIGLITSVISSIFVLFIKEVGSFRESFTVKLLDIPGTSYSLQPVLWLLAAALFLGLVRRLFKLERWHGPAPSGAFASVCTLSQARIASCSFDGGGGGLTEGGGGGRGGVVASSPSNSRAMALCDSRLAACRGGVRFFPSAFRCAVFGSWRPERPARLVAALSYSVRPLSSVCRLWG